LKEARGKRGNLAEQFLRVALPALLDRPDVKEESDDCYDEQKYFHGFGAIRWDSALILERIGDRETTIYEVSTQ
jgi:hypothetical protein